MIAIVKTLRFGAGLLLCVGVAGLLGCKQDAGSAPVRPLPEVGVMAVAAQTIPDDPEFIGQAEASRIVEIRSQVTRSEEHTSELQSRLHLVCRLLLEKKKYLSPH